MDVQKYVGRIQELGQYERRHSSFYIGLYGQNWVRFLESFWEFVTELKIINSNKLQAYNRGLRARRLIASIF